MECVYLDLSWFMGRSKQAKNFKQDSICGSAEQGDQKIGKNCPNLGKSSPKSRQTKKWHNHLHYALLNSINTDNKSYFHPKILWPFKKVAQMAKFCSIWSPCSWRTWKDKRKMIPGSLPSPGNEEKNVKYLGWILNVHKWQN